MVGTVQVFIWIVFNIYIWGEKFSSRNAIIEAKLAGRIEFIKLFSVDNCVASSCLVS